MENQTRQTPKKELMNSALKHYEDAATNLHHWISDIPKAIKQYYLNDHLYLSVNTTSSLTDVCVAGDIWLTNTKTDLKYMISDCQPVGCSIHEARQISKILDCKVFIDDVIDDNREVTIVFPRYPIKLKYSEREESEREEYERECEQSIRDHYENK